MTTELTPGNPEDSTLITSEYVLPQIEKTISEHIETLTGEGTILPLLPVPRRLDADYGVQLTAVARQSGWKADELAEQVASDISSDDLDLFESIKLHGPYINFRLNMGKFATRVIDQVFQMGPDYGKENIGKERVVVVDMSSPNIAKRMSYGHLRSTVIGDAISNLYEATGYEVIRDNHIGDWGTQFGNLITAIKKWGDERRIMDSDDPIGALQELYVRFHDENGQEALAIREEYKKRVEDGGLVSVPELSDAVEAVSQEIMKRKEIKRDQLNIETVLEDALDRVVVTDLEREGRNWFLKLEQGDPEARRLWQLCIDLSMTEFDRLYDVLGVEFDVTYGESFYEGMLEDTIEEVRQSGIGKISDGALIVDMKDINLGVAIIQKSDGASVYMTRDIACALYRETEMGAEKAIYVVGADQKLYFRQLFEILRRMGHDIGENSAHVYFGMVSLPDGKMSTREGRVILLKDVIEEGQKRAEDILKESSPELYKDIDLRKRIARDISIGALKWNDLAYDPKRSIVFDWDKALSMEGYSAPYVQYAAVRANSIIQKSERCVQDFRKVEGYYQTEDEMDSAERDLIKMLARYSNILREAMDAHAPSKVARYAYELAQAFNLFYGKIKVLKAATPELVESRLRLVAATSQVLSNSLGILGIKVPEVM